MHLQKALNDLLHREWTPTNATRLRDHLPHLSRLAAEPLRSGISVAFTSNKQYSQFRVLYWRKSVADFMLVHSTFVEIGMQV